MTILPITTVIQNTTRRIVWMGGGCCPAECVGHPHTPCLFRDNEDTHTRLRFLQGNTFVLLGPRPQYQRQERKRERDETRGRQKCDGDGGIDNHAHRTALIFVNEVGTSLCFPLSRRALLNEKTKRCIYLLPLLLASTRIEIRITIQNKKSRRDGKEQRTRKHKTEGRSTPDTKTP